MEQGHPGEYIDMASPRCLGCQHISWDPRGSVPRSSMSRDPGGNCRDFYVLNSEVSEHQTQILRYFQGIKQVRQDGQDFRRKYQSTENKIVLVIYYCIKKLCPESSGLKPFFIISDDSVDFLGSQGHLSLGSHAAAVRFWMELESTLSFTRICVIDSGC